MKDISYQNKQQKTLEVLLFIVAFSIPISYAFNSISLAVLFLFSFTFFSLKTFLTSFNTKEVYSYYFLFFLIQTISLLYASDTSLALETVKQHTVFLVLPLTFINLKNHIDDRKYKAAFYGLLASILLTIIVSLFNLLYKSLTSEMAISNFFRESFIQEGLYYLVHVPYLSMLIVFTFICVLKIPFTKNTLWKGFVFFVLIVSLFFLSGVMSLAILTLFIGVLFLTSKVSNQLKIGATILVILLSGFSMNYIKNYEELDRVRGSEHLIYRAQKILNSKDSVRISNWNSVTKVISNHPLLGVSADGGLELLQNERSILSEPYINKHNAHNDFLEVTLRYGFVGLLIYLLLLSKLFQNAWQKKKPIFKWFLIVFVISGITEAYLQRQIGLTFFTFFSMLLYTYKPVEDQ